ncbi:uncharacterized protein F5891DRAFT_1188868 [Suillus fuscotomentosus]|uniref:DUF6532 domain-containing protein n=1 Tax=Suillus fuscotomentosus TaxID=1912939 RepID=A0AAD4E5W9_9AGAM|nr:uncharacterized protein F5891DRAFT_1188868 [Suillus fuscotomentosus]KAG1900170.1 hypothetical protein F5891DRAFT_1188868 [Suillus fuscotomentosus]
MSGWGDQPQSQGDELEQYMAPDPSSCLESFDFHFHYQLAHDHRTSGSQHQDLESSWVLSQPQDHDATTVTLPVLAGPSTRAASHHDGPSWTSQLQYWEDGGHPAVLGGGHQAYYHHSEPQPSSHHHDAAIAAHADQHPQSGGHLLQDQLAHSSGHVLDGGHQASYHHSELQPLSSHHHDTDITPHADHRPQSGGQLLQDQLAHPIPYRFSDLSVPNFINAWPQQQTAIPVWPQQQTAIPVENVATSHVMSQRTSLDHRDSGSTSAIPSGTQFVDAFDDIVSHSDIVASSQHRVQVPRESSRSNRSSRRNTKLITTKSTATKRSSAPGLKLIPYGIPEYGIPELLDQCNEKMKSTAFGQSLLPSPDSMNETIYSSWSAVTDQQTDGALQQWALDKLHNDEKFRISKLEPVLMGVLDEMKVVVRLFVYHLYDLAFDYAVTLDVSHVNKRATRVRCLMENDAFLYGRVSIEGVDVSIAFTNHAILAIVSYLLRDSEYQYHRYIGGLNVKPLLAITATFGRWALQEHCTGRYIPSLFLPEINRTHHDHYVSMLNALSPSQLDAITSLLFTNNSIL